MRFLLLIRSIEYNLYFSRLNRRTCGPIVPLEYQSCAYSRSIRKANSNTSSHKHSNHRKWPQISHSHSICIAIILSLVGYLKSSFYRACFCCAIMMQHILQNCVRLCCAKTFFIGVLMSIQWSFICFVTIISITYFANNQKMEFSFATRNISTVMPVSRL